jgi:hypothetical protein
MWIGICGDPSEYSTGSKRHIIEFMLRNPGIALDQSSNRRNTSRLRTSKSMNPLKKRRRKRRRPTIAVAKANVSESSPEYSTGQPDQSHGSLDGMSGTTSPADSEYDNVSSESSGTPSMISIERQTSGHFNFGLRDTAGSPPPPPVAITVPNQSEGQGQISVLPTASSTLAIDQVGDWFDSINTGRYMFVLREPHLVSPEGAKAFTFSRTLQPASPEIKIARKYSLDDLNKLLAESEII